MQRAMWVAVAMIWLGGCAEEEPGEVDSTPESLPGSCAGALEGTCTDYPGAIYSSAVVEQGCAGTYDPDPCEELDRVGQCVMSEGTEEEQLWSFYAPEFTAKSAEASCNATEDARWVGT